MTSTDPLWNCSGKAGMHQWPDLADFCAGCNLAWVDFVAYQRHDGQVVTRDAESIRSTYVGNRPPFFAYVAFAVDALDDPEQLESLVRSAKLAASRDRDVPLVKWEQPLIGRTAMPAKHIDYPSGPDYDDVTRMADVGDVLVRDGDRFFDAPLWLFERDLLPTWRETTGQPERPVPPTVGCLTGQPLRITRRRP